jgi:hypothetical protein
MEEALIGRFLRSVEFKHNDTAEGALSGRPFLSIVTRTQGMRPDTLRDVFLCLSGQSCIDFEHLIVGHRLSIETEALVRGLIAENPGWLRERIRFLKVDHGNRTAPLNAGFAAAAGRYIAVLDDDDLVLGHWVETFKSLAERHSGSILRSGAVYQKYGAAETEFCGSSPRATGEMLTLYPLHFDFFSHLQENRTPPVALAFPRAAFNDLGVTFDETLTTAEDWDYLMRAATLCGVASVPEITAIYRHWSSRGSSRTDHSSAEWDENLRRIHEKLGKLTLLISEGSAENLRRLLDERDMLARAVRLLSRDAKISPSTGVLQDAIDIARRIVVTNSPERSNELRVELTALYESLWWKITAPIRWFSGLIGRRRFQQPDPYDLTEAHLSMAIDGVMNSTSWKLTQPLRSLFAHIERR